jgi:hypothetical protein
MITIILIIMLIAAVIKIRLRPHVDISDSGDVLLWYGRDDRRTYKKLFKL